MAKKFLVVQLIITLLLLPLAVKASDEPKPAVLFDQSHGQRFLIGNQGELQLSGLAETFASLGASVSANSNELTAAMLASAKGVVISGAFASYSQKEVALLKDYVAQGGRLAVMLHIGPPVADLLHAFDVDISNMVLHEQQHVIDGNDINFQVKDLSASPLFAGIPSFSLYGGWALNPGGTVQSIARSSEKAWLDLDGNKKLTTKDVVATFSVTVSGDYGKGSFVFFGDDAIFQNRYLDTHNKALAANLGRWLTGQQ